MIIKKNWSIDHCVQKKISGIENLKESSKLPVNIPDENDTSAVRTTTVLSPHYSNFLGARMLKGIKAHTAQRTNVDHQHSQTVLFFQHSQTSSQIIRSWHFFFNIRRRFFFNIRRLVFFSTFAAQHTNIASIFSTL